MDFINSHLTAIMTGTMFANAYLAGQSQVKREWVSFAVHGILALVSCAYVIP